MFLSMKSGVSFVLIFMTLGLFQWTRASNHYFISAPDVFHLNQSETVSVVIMSTPGYNRPVNVSLHLEGESSQTRFSAQVVQVSPGVPKSVEMVVTYEDLEDSPINVQYINLVAQCRAPHLRFRQSTKIMVSKRSHVVFVQPDKPIYTPLQEVKFRVYTMDLDLKPVKIPLLVDIVNPQGVVLATYDPSDTAFFSGTYSSYGILSSRYLFSDLPVLGNWKVKVKYGYQMQQVSEAGFELEEYTLPTFAVQIESPNVILPSDQYSGIDIHISAKYLYGQAPESSTRAGAGQQRVQFEPVPGVAHVRTGLLVDQENIIYFYNKTDQLNTLTNRRSHGPKTTFSINLKHLFDDMGFSFDSLVGHRLYVEATVTDQGTGIRNTEVQTNAIFSKHKFIIDLSQTPKYFTPGLFTVRMKTMYPNGVVKKKTTLAINGESLSAQTNSWSRLNRIGRGANPNKISTDDNGKAQYTFKIPQDAKKINIDIAGTSKVMMNSFDGTGSEERSSASFTATRYQSNTKSSVHIHLAQISALQPSSLLHVNIHLTIGDSLSLPRKYYYMVLGRGSILQQGVRDITQTNSGVSVTPLYISVTEDMSPGARLLVYYVQNTNRGQPEVIADALWFEVEKECAHQDANGDLIDVALYTGKSQYRPSEEIWLRFQANPNSVMALLAVDEAVYQLNGDNSLTSHKMFQMLQDLDTGCSPGGGRDNKHVFQGAGLTTINNLGLHTSMRQSEKCTQSFSRSKRATNEETENSLEECCTQGILEASKKKKKSACISQSVQQFGKSADCRNQMFRCCLGHLKSPRDYPLPTTTTTTTSTTTTTTPDPSQNFNRQSVVIDRVLPAFYAYRHDYEDLSRWGFVDGSFDNEEWDDTEFEVEFADFNGIPARRRFPESFFFQTAPVGSVGIEQVRVTLPDTITTWVFQGVAVHKEKGICVAPPHNITTFKKLFIKVNMPATAVKGEQVVVKATFYNYHDDYQGVPARAYLFVDYGICAKSRPHRRSQRVSLGRILERKTKSHSWPIIPLRPGSFNITVVVTTPKGVDKVEKWLFVKPPGEIRNISLPILLDPSGRSAGYLGDTSAVTGSLGNYINNSIQVNPPKQEVRVNVSALTDVFTEHAVPGTKQCSVKIEGSILAPIVDKLVNEEGLNSLWGIPSASACGEQTISKVAPTIMAALYLKETNRLTKPLEKKAKRLIKNSLERELRFRQKDGSFSFWPNTYASQRDKGKSTWLTAFVVKLMALAATKFEVMLRFESQSVSTQGVICEAVSWLLTQQKNDGHFHEPYADSFQRFRLVGGVQNTKSLTAFVLIALSQAQDTVEEHCSKDITSDLQNGVRYLENNAATLKENTTDPFTVAIVTYALVLFNSPDMYGANRVLQSRMDFDAERNIRYLPEYDLEDYDSFMKDWPWWRQHYWSYVKSAVTVEQTAYALLAQIHLQDYNYAFPVVAWLLSQRNNFGAFRSTQDTVVALEALTIYKIGSDEMRTNLQCDLKLQNQANPIESYTLNDNLNKLNNERVLSDSEINQGDLIIETSGEGTAQAFLNIQYYSLPPATQSAGVCPEFSLQITDDADFFGVHKVKVCARNLQTKDTGMGIVDIGIVTGQKVRKESVVNMQNDVTIGEKLTTYNIGETSVTLYFEKIPRDDDLCVTITTNEYDDVENIQPATVSVYDYYEPNKRCSKFYGSEPQSNQNSGILRHSCDANGQCQCGEY